MFVFTARLDRRKLIAGILAIVVIVAAAVILFSGDDGEAEAAIAQAVVRTNDDRVAFLASMGWEVTEEPLEQQTIVIPKDFTQVYKKYNELQIAQGFDLEKYAGMEAVRYTYEVLNYPDGDGTVVADIIVYRSKVIAGDVQSVTMDGFMRGLEYPDAE